MSTKSSPLSLLLAGLLALAGSALHAQDTTFRVRQVFQLGEAGKPFGELILGSDGFVYGMGAAGGSNGHGSIFRLNRDGSGLLILKECVVADGIFPYGGLTEGPDGRLYGCLSFGGNGAAGNGVVFAMNKDGSGFTKLKVFTNASDGKSPVLTPVFGTDGFLYSGCTSGGTNDLGTLFRIAPNGSNFEVLHQCAAATGSSPSSLIRFGSNFLGTTTYGGANTLGAFFAMGASGSPYNVAQSFAIMDGAIPSGTPILNAANDAIGPLSGGGANNFGVIYKLGSTYERLHDFGGTVGGSAPVGKLALSSRDGFYYGVTRGGGANGGGVLYRLSTDGSQFEVLKELDGDSGTEPQAGLLEVYPGVFLGSTTKANGMANSGTIFLFNSVAAPAEVTIDGPLKRTVSSSRAKIRGTARDEIEVTQVTYKAGRKPWRTALGTTKWSFKAPLKPGRNRIQVRATDHDGTISKPVRMLVTRG